MQWESLGSKTLVFRCQDLYFSTYLQLIIDHKEGYPIEGVVSRSLVISNLSPELLTCGFLFRWPFLLELWQNQYLDFPVFFPHFYPHLTWHVLAWRIWGVVASSLLLQFPLLFLPLKCHQLLTVSWAKYSKTMLRVPDAAGNTSIRL